MALVKVVVAEAGESVDDAAQIWAEATAARDGDVDVTPLDLSRPIIEAVVNRSDRSLLLIALDADGRALGFAAAEPTSDAEGERSSTGGLDGLPTVPPSSSAVRAAGTAIHTEPRRARRRVVRAEHQRDLRVGTLLHHPQSSVRRARKTNTTSPSPAYIAAKSPSPITTRRPRAPKAVTQPSCLLTAYANRGSERAGLSDPPPAP